MSSHRRQWHPTPVLLPGKSHGWRSLEGCSPWGRWGSDKTERLHFHFLFSCIGEGNGNPLQRSCLENRRDRGAWWAAVYGVAKSQTRLKWLSSSSSSVLKVHLCWYKITSHHVTRFHSFLRLSDTPLYIHPTISSSICLSKGGTSTSWLLWKMLLLTWVYMSQTFLWELASSSFGYSLEVELLGHVVILFLFIWCTEVFNLM